MTLMMPNASARPTPNIHAKYHINFSLVRSVSGVFVVFDMLEGDLAAHHPVHPGGVQHDDRQHDDHYPEHDAERLVARYRIPDGEAAAGVERGRHDERE